MPTSEATNLKITTAGRTATMQLYGVISDWDENSAQNIAEQIADLDVDTIELELHSRGGSVIEGLAIYNALSGHPATVNCTVMGAALSIASLIAMAADRIRMPKNAFMMIHRPRMVVFGESEQLRSGADTLDAMQETIIDAYADRASLSRDEVADLLQPGKETWMRAPECLDKGFCDEVIQPLRMAAGPLDLGEFQNVPEWATEAVGHGKKPETPKPKRKNKMADKPNEPQAATLKQLKEKFPSSTAEWREGQIEAEATLQDAAIAFANFCQQQAEAANKRADEAEKKRAKPDPPAGLGVDPIDSGGAGDDDEVVSNPIAEFDAEVRKLMARNIPRQDAVNSVRRNNPELSKQYMIATNQGSRRQRLIEERFEDVGV